MEKQQTSFFEEPTFSDINAARKLKTQAEKKLKWIKIGFILALIATAFLLIRNPPKIIFELWIILVILSYVFGGGLTSACKLYINIVKWGWIIMPFPIDLITGGAALFLGLAAFFLFPIVFVLANYFDWKKKLNAAEEQINYFENYDSYQQTSDEGSKEYTSPYDTP